MKRFFKFLTLILIISIIIASPSLFTVSASTGHIYTVPMSKPAASDTMGFMEIFFNNGSKSSVLVVAWNFTHNYVSDFDDCYLDVQMYDDRVIAKPILKSYDEIAYFNYIYVFDNGNYHCNYVDLSNSEPESFDFLVGCNIFSVKVYGNARLINNTSKTFTDFSVLYAESSCIYNQLLHTVSSLNNIYANDVRMNERIYSILSFTSSIDFRLAELTNFLTQAISDMSSDIQANQDKNTDRVINAGENVNQPDFDSTNGSVNDTTNTMQSIEGQYQIDATSTQAALNEGTSFMQGSNMQLASIQVKNWIERFTSDNKIITGFLISSMVLGLCFWVIGRKAS